MLKNRWPSRVSLSSIYHLIQEGIHFIFQWWMCPDRCGRISDITSEVEKAIPSQFSRETGISLSLLRDSSPVIKSSFEWNEMLLVFHVIQLLHKRECTNSLVRLFGGRSSSYFYVYVWICFLVVVVIVVFLTKYMFVPSFVLL
ncbi:Uncharacterized protein TCM_031762 [Theobroma cacao]|uniref:Uncharacterized protein n=1 Tax=Theobroma cacao TaxID=3641 RepID=A0A061F882_THECC|nr:Uncharacterized protein TCM_031762 [Theobroma cacao]